MKHILCFGDSNTHGFIPGGGRYKYENRWTGILAKRLGEYYHVMEEGLNGRTSSFDDPFDPFRNAMNYIVPCLQTHQPLDLTIIMLGTNDMKCYFSPSLEKISSSIENLITIAKKYTDGKILLVSPILLGDEMKTSSYASEFPDSSIAISHELGKAYQQIAKRQHIAFINAADFAEPSSVDSLHLTPEGHKKLADAIFGEIRFLNL